MFLRAREDATDGTGTLGGVAVFASSAAGAMAGAAAAAASMGGAVAASSAAGTVNSAEGVGASTATERGMVALCQWCWQKCRSTWWRMKPQDGGGGQCVWGGEEEEGQRLQWHQTGKAVRQFHANAACMACEL